MSEKAKVIKSCASCMFVDVAPEGIPCNTCKPFTSKWREKNTNEQLDHPCKETCSGWQQGYLRGYGDAEEEYKAQIERMKSPFSCSNERCAAEEISMYAEMGINIRCTDCTQWELKGEADE